MASPCLCFRSATKLYHSLPPDSCTSCEGFSFPVQATPQFPNMLDPFHRRVSCSSCCALLCACTCRLKPLALPQFCVPPQWTFPVSCCLQGPSCHRTTMEYHHASKPCCAHQTPESVFRNLTFYCCRFAKMARGTTVIQLGEGHKEKTDQKLTVQPISHIDLYEPLPMGASTGHVPPSTPGQQRLRTPNPPCATPSDPRFCYRHPKWRVP